MAQEIEEYLFSQFRSGLEWKESGSGSKIPLYSYFTEIRDSLEEIFKSPSPVPASIREKLYYLNNVLTECQMLSRTDLVTRYNITMKLKNIKTELKGINVSSSNGNNTSAQANGQASSSTEKKLPRWSSRSVDASKVHGFDDEVIQLEKMIVNNNDHFKVIGIVGMPGIGKTTLCQVIFNKQEVKDYFLPRIWVCMSRKPTEDGDIKIIIVKRMLVYLGVEEEIIKSASDIGLVGLLYTLHLQLVGKRYLIVFDDARDEDNIDSWYEQLDSSLTRDGKWDGRLGYGLPKGSGGAVLVTSRSEEVAKKMVGQENIHRLLPLSDPESCWLIFKDSAEQGGSGRQFNPSNAQELKKEILQKCAGLPLTDLIENPRGQQSKSRNLSQHLLVFFLPGKRQINIWCYDLDAAMG